MWARVVEFMLACWLCLSPFIFHHPEEATAMWANDFGIALLIAVLALASFLRRTGGAHWLLLGVALWLIVFGRFAAQAPLPPGLQNNIVIGLLLGMFAIIPNRADEPPESRLV